MKKILKLGFILAAYASVACVSLALVYNVTAPAIERVKQEKAGAGMKIVFAQADAFVPVQDFERDAAFEGRRIRDDNPDIMRYMGYGDLRLAYQFDNKHALSGTLRYNPKHNKGAVQLNYTFPLKGNLKGYVQGFYGYGESLIDYN